MLDKFIRDRRIEESTISGYKTAISQYESFHGMKIEELILEAWNDEEEHNAMYKRRIQDRILDFRTALLESEELSETTINNKIGKLQSFYTHYGVQFPKVKGLKNKQPQLTYFDLPNREHIILALESTSIQNQAIILFLCSSGTGKSEAASITIADFLKATEEYHNGGTLEEIIEELWKTQEPLVPTFALKRRKTSREYYTFCTPEATFAILRYLKHRLKILDNKNKKEGTNTKLELSEPLFGVNDRGISDRLRNINDKLEFGFKGKFRFFRSHSLRKFHASNIGLSEEHVDMLQGRKKDVIHETYIKSNPKYLKQIYMNVMDNVTIRLEDQRIVKNEEYNLNIHLHFHDEGLNTTIS